MINQQRLLDTFTTLVAIDNPSGQEAAMAADLIGRLKTLGFAPEQDAKGNVITRVPGEGEPILLSAHMDSVATAIGKRAVVRDGVVYSEGDTVLGADDLAGVSAILEGVASVREQNRRHRAAEIVFSVEEEVGLRGAKALDWSKISAKWGVALDLNGDVGGICVSAPAQNTLRITIHGKAAHAGVAPEQGINAILVAAEALASMPLGRIDAETTANIGTIQGGAAKNIVPDRVVMIGEARSRDEAKLEAQTTRMREALEAAARNRGATVEVEVTREYNAQRTPVDSPIVELCQRTMRQLGLEPRLIESGGGSDVNVFTANDINAVNLSLGYREIHSSNEYIPVANLQRAAEVVASLLTLD